MGEEQRLKRKVRNSYAISTLSIALVLFLLGSVGYLITTALDVSHSLREEITATVEIKRGVGEQQMQALREQVAAHPLSLEVSFSSADEKAEDSEFRKMFGVEFEDVLGENPLMDSFEIKLSAQAHDTELMAEFMNYMQELEGVDRVSYPAQLVEQIHSMVGRFQVLLLIFGGALLLISLILLNSSIRLAIYSRRYLINTMKLVGATKWFIIKPFLGRSVVCGLWAGVIASMLFGVAYYMLQEGIPELFSNDELLRAGVVVATMVVVGVAISGLFTLLAVNRFVNMKSNKIQLY
ncbi:MAG: permease-like cell division protein FtsX [Rikenellaceae bacterium]